ncbi:DNA binding methylated-DNA--cysteine S-methyltransferase [Suhomyces tanzawaensis NRRL Y-17324]|uniref:Methylated-DNA--protein-cysteine methyltransferase n=1 Tax=Suhomyces tanzawaensis NRRL Y-17324 TaxID=984487 RepID=A0A1E4SB60_9ASCO|nr:DNA binding methylated-DNA--cysteine S-methyltransferase [Suhomyces tanzawaensis NRRL Y-17324]ODV76706.1 DNA binding methylated-DNA--cysteine S-methyltransferase [Suhomyces tanzawaensis NRRL Y-17324]
MLNLFYTTVPASSYHALVVVDKDGTLYYMTLSKTNTGLLQLLMVKDFSKHTHIRLNALSSTTLIKDASRINQTVALVREAMEDPKSMDISKIKYKIIFGTSLQRRVWDKLLEIEPGTVTDYFTLAGALKMPTSSRVVGNCVGANRIALFIPCHRVLTKDRKISGYRYGVEVKRDILQLELGQEFDKLVN